MTGRKSIKISAVNGNSQMLDGGSMFGNAPRALWQRWTDVDEKGRIPLACRALLIETEDTKVLCEAGIGNYLPPELAARYGVVEQEHVLLNNLGQLGVAPRDIDYIIMSHLHFDHAGGLLPSYQEIAEGNERIIFDNATIVVGRQAWERALLPHFRDRASFIPSLNRQLAERGDKLRILEEGQTLAELDFLEFFTSNGHTPGQVHTVIRGETEKVVFCGDLVPGAPWVHLPITMGYDRFPEKLIDEKKALYERMDDHWHLFFTHDIKIALAKIKKNEKGKYDLYDAASELERFAI